MIGCLDPDGLTGRARNESHFLEELPHLRRVRCDVGKKMWFNCVAAEVTRRKSAATGRIYGEGQSLFLDSWEISYRATQSAATIQVTHPPTRSTETKRYLTLDAYHGFIMLMLASEGIWFLGTAQ